MKPTAMSPEALIEAMRKLGLRTNTFAAEIGVSPSHISRFRKGKARIPKLLADHIRMRHEIKELQQELFRLLAENVRMRHELTAATAAALEQLKK